MSFFIVQFLTCKWQHPSGHGGWQLACLALPFCCSSLGVEDGHGCPAWECFLNEANMADPVFFWLLHGGRPSTSWSMQERRRLSMWTKKVSPAVDGRIKLEWQVVRQLLKFWEPYTDEYDILLARWTQTEIPRGIAAHDHYMVH